MSHDRKRELRRAYKLGERQRAQAALPLGASQLAGLLDHLDSRLGREVCDHSLRFTREWAAANGVDADELAASLEELGGYCDCEVLANVEPETIFGAEAT